MPKPQIPDFTTDSEKEFANLKLALDNLLEPYPELTEKYKYHVLLEHLKLPEAQMIGQSCRHDPFPYTVAMQALQLQCGQLHQLARSEIATILTTPDVKSGDARTFQSFALRVHLLVSMLLSSEGPQGMELNCCSHVNSVSCPNTTEMGSSNISSYRESSTPQVSTPTTYKTLMAGFKVKLSSSACQTD